MPDDDTEEYWDCSPGEFDPDSEERMDYERGELLQAVDEAGGDVKEFARSVMVAGDECDGEDISYTGVHPSGERRECPACMGVVKIDPVDGVVEHVENE